MIQTLSTRPTPAQLKSCRLFAGIPTEPIEAMSSDIVLLRLDSGEVLFKERDPGECFYIVLEGSICISKLGRSDKQETLCYMQSGNFFGEMTLVDGLPRSAQATAAKDSVLARVDRATFDRILAIAPRELHMNFLRCVTERLREVNGQFMTELIRTERLSLVGTMANSIIHDLKNPLTIIQSASEILKMKVSDPSVDRFTQMVNRAVKSMLDMTQEILDFARGQSSFELKQVPIQALLEELEGQLEQIVPGSIQIQRDIDCQAEVRLDVGRFSRMLLNLIKNSVEAMPKGGTLSLSIRQQDKKVLFRITDTGCGIPPELQAQVFEPFMTFGKSKGTGLGMAIVKNVVEAHNGTISLESQVGVGTTMEVALEAQS